MNHSNKALGLYNFILVIIQGNITSVIQSDSENRKRGEKHHYCLVKFLS